MIAKVQTIEVMIPKATGRKAVNDPTNDPNYNPY